MSPRTRDCLTLAADFVRRNFNANPDAARSFTAVTREIADERTATATTGLERAVAASLTLAADAATRALTDLEEATR